MSLRNTVEIGLWQSQNKKKERLLRRYHSSQRLAEGASAKLELRTFLLAKTAAVSLLAKVLIIINNNPAFTIVKQ